jgi:hypothetical protein
VLKIIIPYCMASVCYVFVALLYISAWRCWGGLESTGVSGTWEIDIAPLCIAVVYIHLRTHPPGETSLRIAAHTLDRIPCCCGS